MGTDKKEASANKSGRKGDAVMVRVVKGTSSSESALAVYAKNSRIDKISEVAEEASDEESRDGVSSSAVSL